MDAIRSLSSIGACLLGVSVAVLCGSCSSSQEPVVAPTPPAPSVITSPPGTPTPAATAISSDAELFTRVTQKEPFATYGLFPNADEITSGTLNGSSAHHPLVRTSLNATALGALQNGKLPAGAKFPNGSIGYSITNRGAGCTSCHSLERGPENDFVRTFESQR